MIVIVSGPINAGKSSVARRLARLVPASLFVDGDDLAPSDLPLEAKAPLVIDQLIAIALSVAEAGLHLFAAYPVDPADWRKIEHSLRTAGYAVTCVTLAPPIDVALSERGGRQLSQ